MASNGRAGSIPAPGTFVKPQQFDYQIVGVFVFELLGKYWALSVLAAKIFYFLKYKIGKNPPAETGVIRCYGRQRATNLYFSDSRRQM